jgi:hypothetical protein
MFSHHLLTVYSGVCLGVVSLALAAVPVQDRPKGQSNSGNGEIQRLPNFPRRDHRLPQASPDLPGELSDLQNEPRPGLYDSAPYSMIIRVPGSITAPMPTTIPPRKGYSERSIEPEILLIPRKKPSL